MEKGLKEIAKMDSGTVEEIIENYFIELKKSEELENRIKILKEEVSCTNKNIHSINMKLGSMLKDTKSDSLLIEIDGKKVILALTPGKESVAIKEVVTPKELKTRLALNKMSGKKSSLKKKDCHVFRAPRNIGANFRS